MHMTFVFNEGSFDQRTNCQNIKKNIETAR